MIAEHLIIPSWKWAKFRGQISQSAEYLLNNVSYMYYMQWPYQKVLNGKIEINYCYFGAQFSKLTFQHQDVWDWYCCLSA